MFNPLYEKAQNIEFFTCFNECVGKTLTGYLEVNRDISPNFILVFDYKQVFSFSLYAERDRDNDITGYTLDVNESISKEDACDMGLYDRETLDAEYAIYREHVEKKLQENVCKQDAVAKAAELATKEAEKTLLLEKLKQFKDDKDFLTEISNLLKGA